MMTDLQVAFYKCHLCHGAPRLYLTLLISLCFTIILPLHLFSFDSVALCTVTVYFSRSKVCMLPVVMVFLTQIMVFAFIFAFTIDLALTSFYQSCTWNSSLFRLLQFDESFSAHSAFQSAPRYWESLTKPLLCNCHFCSSSSLFY